MWSEARSWVLRTAGMKIQTITDDYIEAYNAVGGSVRLSVLVNKVALGGGRYRFEAKAWCDNIFGCFPDRLDALISFNEALNKHRKITRSNTSPGGGKFFASDRSSVRRVEVGKYQYQADELRMAGEG